ncbi:MAG TPA: hypothetical protein VH394_04825 [Thermoanaerobaculia bacterium]|jgi:hypothetical protein|nr:hypothetical protein [Thermoanaerobaculia bacterium]
MKRHLAVWLLPCLILALFAWFVSAQESANPQISASAQIATELRLERKLLALDLAAYREARGVEQRTRDQVGQSVAKLDQALTGDQVALGTLESVHLELSSSRAASQIAADRVEWQLQRLEDRLRRIGFLESESGVRAAEAPRDPLTGRWRVVVLPQNQTGTFDLTLTGTLVSGSYTLSGGNLGNASGSFRGTYADTHLRLERVDARRGFDSVFLGTVDPATGRLSGTWSANDLASGQPARGDWSANREGAGNEKRP